MKSLRDYIADSETWMNTPSAGDDFAMELPDEVLVETYIIEVADDCILLDSTPEINQALSESVLLEDTDEGDSGVIMETMGYGTLVGEGQMKQEMWDMAERMSREAFIDYYGGDEEFLGDFWDGVHGVDEDQSAGVVAQKEFDIDAAQRLATDEAEYQGRKVALGKPMAGDVKKFKVYVKDPKTGNVKKVNFGDKTMRIKKSNPARRKSFRARHNCANPGPRTKARYWSCRKW